MMFTSTTVASRQTIAIALRHAGGSQISKAITAVPISNPSLRPGVNHCNGLAARASDYPRTHNLGALIEMLGKAGVALPADLADIDRLTPFGTVFRYDEVLPKAGKDRSRWLGWIRALRTFVESYRPPCQ